MKMIDPRKSVIWAIVLSFAFPYISFSTNPGISISFIGDLLTLYHSESYHFSQAEGNCKKFSDYPHGDEIKQDYVIYRDLLKMGDYEEAFSYWQNVYKTAPAADGKRWTVYGDGIRIYEGFIQMEEDESKKAQYVETIFQLYHELTECYPEQKGYVTGRVAFDYYYKYPALKTNEEKYELFRRSLDLMDLNTPAFVINPFTALIIRMYLDDEISQEEAKEYSIKILNIIEHQKEKGELDESWKIVESFTPPSLERFEGVKNFYNCQYYLDKYYANFEEIAGDCEIMLLVYSKLRFGGCYEEDEQLQDVYARLLEYNCIDTREEWEKTAIGRAKKYLQEGEYQKSITEFETAVEETENTELKAEYMLLIAKVYYAHLKHFPKSRTYALNAIKLRPNWGPPYILIGKLYASSGPLCGPGTGFGSQVVTWPAIDKWIKAKSIDPSVTNEANKLINTYSVFMPDKEDIFFRELVVGSNYKVGCWIQEITKIRTSD